MTDLLGGQINLIFATAASAVPHVKSGKINALAVTTSNRSKLVPDLPTVAEAGLKGFEANNWYGVVVPLKTPRAIIDRLNREFGGPEDARDPGDPVQAGTRRRAEHARGDSALHQGRDREVGEGDQGLRREAGVTREDEEA